MPALAIACFHDGSSYLGSISRSMKLYSSLPGEIGILTKPSVSPRVFYGSCRRAGAGCRNHCLSSGVKTSKHFSKSGSLKPGALRAPSASEPAPENLPAYTFPAAGAWLGPSCGLLQCWPRGHLSRLFLLSRLACFAGQFDCRIKRSPDSADGLWPFYAT